MENDKWHAVVSIRSPQRSHAFQSAPPTEVRGDLRLKDHRTVFQSAPPTEVRGDTLLLAFHMFQSAPPTEVRGDQVDSNVSIPK